MSQRAIGNYVPSARLPCSDAVVKDFIKEVNSNLWLSNALMVGSAVLIAIMVAVGTSGRRYHRHHKGVMTHFVFLGASTLYLPIVSYVISSVGKEQGRTCRSGGLEVLCYGRTYLAFLLTWTVLVQIVGTNTSAIVATADHDDHSGDHTKLGPSIQLLTRTVWTSYLVFYYSHQSFVTTKDYHNLGFDTSDVSYGLLSGYLIVLCLLSLAKIMLKFYAFQIASKSFALGRNSRLIVGYMHTLLDDDDNSRPEPGPGPGPEPIPPPLVVMGEDSQEIEETPHGYTIKQRNSNLVTVDMVWRLGSDTLLASRPWLKDLCLSFAMFKLLRCRFATSYLVVEPAKAFNTVLVVFLNSRSPESVFNVLADEMSFVLDSYYSSLPTSNFGRLLPLLNIIISLSIITWCLCGCAISRHYSVHHHYQTYCDPIPITSSPKSCRIPSQYLNLDNSSIAFGNIIFNTLPTICLFVAVIVAEAWEIASYLCSNWIKVTLLCSYITQPSWQRSPRVQRWLGRVLELKKVNLRRSWNDRMGQIQLLPVPAPPHALMTRRLFLLFSDPNPRIKHVQVPLVVKAAIVDALRSSNGRLSKGTAALRKSSIGDRLLWACEAQSTCELILAWHISTGIFEARHGGAAGASSASSSSTMRTVATSLSRYCVYLMAAAPELLPDDRAWSRKLYGAVISDIERALAAVAGDEPVDHQHEAGWGMVTLLDDRSEHEVVKRGVKLGKQLLLELAPDEEEEAGWALLASFWSEMMLFVAPSDSLKARHKEAIARGSGTELLTVVWALLTHTGIVSRTSIRTAV